MNEQAGSNLLHSRSWLGQAIRDTDDLADIAYVSLFCVMVVTVGTIPYLGVMAYLDWLTCAKDCHFALKELGESVGLVCAGFATALGALAGYMAATRKPKPEIAK